MSFKDERKQLVATFERDYIFKLLQECEWNISEAARRAKLSRYTMYILIKKHNIRV